jgi:GTPase SAR1 family protein
MRIILVGTKSDQNSERKVSFENAEKYAKENDMLFIECSSKSNKNIDTIF